MSIESRMKAVINDRKNNFYDMFDEYMADDQYYFTESEDPSFDFIEKYDEDGNPVYADPEQAKIYKARKARFKMTTVVIDSNSNIYYTEDESSEYFGYSYDEIIGMANNGVTIPDEILDWAYSMSDANSVEISTDTEGSTAHDLYTTLKNNPFLNIKTITKIFVNQCDEQTKELEAYLEELNPFEREMEAARVDAETDKEKSLNNFKSLVKEWKDLQAKLSNGEELTSSEQERFEELQGLFAAEDEKYQESIDDSTRNFSKISSKLTLVSQKADIAFDFGTETIFVSEELADFEKSAKNRSIFGGLIGAGIAGVLGAVGLAGSKKFSKTAHTVGLNTQYFADDVNTTIKEVQLLMQDTAETAGFELDDPSYTVDSLAGDEGIVEPTVKRKSKATEGNQTDAEGMSTPDLAATTVEPPQDADAEAPVESAPADGSEGAAETGDAAEGDAATEEEQTDEEMMSSGETTLEEVNAKELSLPKLKRLIKEEGEDSEKKGKDALKLVEQLKSQSAVVDQKEEQVEEDTQNLKETSEEEPAEGSEGSEGTDGNESALETAQAGAEESQNDLQSATEEEALTVEGLRETFAASKKSNVKYSKDVDLVNKEMKDHIYTGAFTIAGGGYMTGVGIYNVVTGSALLSAGGWWNPAIIALATYMINQGTLEIILGASMIAGGTALTVSATDGLSINEETDEKIGLSGEDITTAEESLNEIEREQKGEVEGGEGGEGAEGTEENENTEEPKEDEALNKDKSLLGKMQEGNEVLPPLRSLSLTEGKQSAAIGKENIVNLVTLERQIPTLIESTITFEQAKQEKAAESVDPESDKTSTTVQDPAEIYAQYREDYNADLATNNAFKKDIRETNQNATTNLGYAALGTTAGAARTALGASEIALGTILAAQWFNPVAMMLGMMLIKKGIEDTALGTEMLATGLALTVNSTTTLVAGGIASKQVSESDEKTNNALQRVNAIESEINAAVQEQMAANGEQDLSGMSVIQLLTLIIMNGIKSSVLGTENTEVLETLKAQLPQLLEKAGEDAQTTEEEVSETPEENAEVEPENNEDPAAEGEEGGEGQGEGEDDGVFAQYKNDFKKDLETNQRYKGEIAQAKGMKKALQGSFFMGAPIEKATGKIEVSNEQTTIALEETEKMEEQVKKAEEEKRQAQEGTNANGEVVISGSAKVADGEEEAEGVQDTEYNEENAYIPDYSQVKVKMGKVVDCETAPADITQDEEAEEDLGDFEKDEKKLAKKEKKEAKKVKKLDKEQKNADKEIESSDKEIEALDQKIEENKEAALEQEQQGLAAQEEAPSDEAEDAGAQAEAQLTETATLSSETTDLAAEMLEVVNLTKAEVQAATAENQGIVVEMNAINTQLQQDQNRMRNLQNQAKQEAKKDSGSSSSEPKAPEPKKPEPQPTAQPQKTPKVAPKKQPKVEEEKPEEEKPEEQTPEPQQPVQVPAPKQEEEAEAPEGSDKTEFASDKNKQPDFVGFVAQSDGLASGSVLVKSKSKSQGGVQGSNNGGSGVAGNTIALKNKQKQQKAKKQQQKQQQKQANQAQAGQEEQPFVAANRTAPKAFDIKSMQGGAGGAGGAGGNGKAQQIKTSMQAIRTAAFAKQAKLNALHIRANNNVMANIQKEAVAQAEAAKKERLAREKQERIAKIKEYAGYVQGVGGLATTTGTIVEMCGTAATAKGVETITTGTQKVVEGVQGVATATGKVVSGTTTITCGTTQITIGTTQEVTGGAQIVAGTATIATGTGTVTAGTITAATGASLAAGVITSPASPPPIAAGAVTISAGTATIATGTGMEVAGGVLEATGLVEQGTGATTVSKGSVEVAEGSVKIGEYAAKIADGTTSIVEGTEKVVSGAGLISTGGVIQSIGVYTTAAGAATSAGADIANGNILGGIASIVGAAASIVGINTNLTTWAQAGVQLASNGVALGTQIATMNAGQENNNNQDKKKKKKFKQNARTQGIIEKTANRKQKVGNRFNK